MNKIKLSIKKTSLHILLFLGVLILWEGVIIIFNIPSTYFASVGDTATNLYYLLINKEIYLNFGVTFFEAIAGFLIGSVSGVIVGILVSEIKLIKKYIYPYILASQALPIIAMAPLFLIWFGFGMASKIALAITIVFFPVVVNTVTGIANVDRSLIKLLQVYGANKWQIFIRVKLLESLPYILASLEIAIVLSVSAAVVSEFIGSKMGLGYLIMSYNNQLNMGAQFAVLIILGVLGITLNYIIQWINRKVIFWDDKYGKEINTKAGL